MDMLPEPLLTVGDISYYILTPQYQDLAHTLISRVFCHLPITQPLQGTPQACGYQEWFEFHSYWMEYTASNGLSVMALDRSMFKMVGVLTLRDLAVKNEELTEKYKDDSLALTPFMHFICRYFMYKYLLKGILF